MYVLPDIKIATFPVHKVDGTAAEIESDDSDRGPSRTGCGSSVRQALAKRLTIQVHSLAILNLSFSWATAILRPSKRPKPQFAVRVPKIGEKRLNVNCKASFHGFLQKKSSPSIKSATNDPGLEEGQIEQEPKQQKSPDDAKN